MAPMPAASTIEFRLIGARVAPFCLSWRENADGGAGDSVTFTDHSSGMEITIGMLGPNRVALEFTSVEGEVEPDDGV